MNVKQPNYDQEQTQTGNAFDFRNQIENFSVSNNYDIYKSALITKSNSAFDPLML